MTGLGWDAMPSFADNIKPEEGWDLVRFLRTLEVSLKTPEPAAFRQWASAHKESSSPSGKSSRREEIEFC
ncbi:MAG: hypothetical protein DMF15_05765 [Verrucomicrobia bacterium]|nr:MAG: hypothetical protein DMF15_05765 [Verrucomicrobiota bacterium]